MWGEWLKCLIKSTKEMLGPETGVLLFISGCLKKHFLNIEIQKVSISYFIFCRLIFVSLRLIISVIQHPAEFQNSHVHHLIDKMWTKSAAKCLSIRYSSATLLNTLKLQDWSVVKDSFTHAHRGTTHSHTGTCKVLYKQWFKKQLRG